MEVSVIIPNYNYSKYIEECIYSVINSDFAPSELEIIVVDDASKDDSVSIVNKIKASTNIQLKIIEHETNLGLANARNTGIKNARGKYLFFLDSDNYIGKDCLKKHYIFLNSNKMYTACYAPIQKFDDATRKLLDIMSNDVYDLNRLAYQSYIDAMSMIRKDDLVHIGLFDTQMPYSGVEDYELWLRMGTLKKNIYFIEGAPLSYYRIHKNSMINTITPSNRRDKLISYLKAKYTLKEIENDIALIYDVNIKIFWAGNDKLFSEEKAISDYVRLTWNKKKVVFQIPSSERDITYLRFDIGEQAGFINIHAIIIRDANHNIVWEWSPNNRLSQENILLISNNNRGKKQIIQASTNTDPQFIIETLSLTNGLIINGHTIEVIVSAINNDQWHLLNSALTRPMPTYIFEEDIRDKEVDIRNKEERIKKLKLQVENINNFLYKQDETKTVRSSLCIFSASTNGFAVDDSVYYYLNYLKTNHFDIVFVGNSKISEPDLEKLNKICKRVIEKKSIKFDISAYKAGLLAEDYGCHYDSILLTNDSMYGPLFALKGIIEKMSVYDFWGLTDSYENVYHLSGYFLLFNSKVISNKLWKDFWIDINDKENKGEDLSFSEIDLSISLIESSLFNYSPYIRYADFVKYIREQKGYYYANGAPSQKKYDATLFYWDTLIEDFNFPFLKKVIPTKDARELGIINKPWKEVIIKNSYYPLELINEYKND